MLFYYRYPANVVKVTLNALFTVQEHSFCTSIIKGPEYVQTPAQIHTHIILSKGFPPGCDTNKTIYFVDCS